MNQVVHLKQPEPRRFVIASGGKPAVIRADRHRIDRALVAAQDHGAGSRLVAIGSLYEAINILNRVQELIGRWGDGWVRRDQRIFVRVHFESHFGSGHLAFDSLFLDVGLYFTHAQ